MGKVILLGAAFGLMLDSAVGACLNVLPFHHNRDNLLWLHTSFAFLYLLLTVYSMRLHTSKMRYKEDDLVSPALCSVCLLCVIIYISTPHFLQGSQDSMPRFSFFPIPPCKLGFSQASVSQSVKPFSQSRWWLVQRQKVSCVTEHIRSRETRFQMPTL